MFSYYYIFDIPAKKKKRKTKQKAKRVSYVASEEKPCRGCQFSSEQVMKMLTLALAQLANSAEPEQMSTGAPLTGLEELNLQLTPFMYQKINEKPVFYLFDCLSFV